MSPEPGPHDVPRKKISIVIADDHGVILKGLQQLFSEEPDLEVVAACSGGDAALEATRTCRPDVLLLDLRMPGRSGTEVMRELVARGDTTRVILLTANLDENDMIEALRLGVRGVVLKEMAPKLLVQCIRKVHAGERWLEKDVIGRAMEKMLAREDALQAVQKVLTARELEILRLVASGSENAEIANQLCVSIGTVKTHVHAIYEKLGVRGRVNLTLWAKERGLA